MASPVAAQIKKQVEFYFSDSNFRRDEFLLAETARHPGGFVPFSVLFRFKKLAALTTDPMQLAAALRGSDVVELNGTQDALRRRHALPAQDDSAKCMAVLAGLGPKLVTVDEIKKALEPLGVEPLFVQRQQVDKEFTGVVHVEFADEWTLQRVVSEADRIVIRSRKPAVMPLFVFNSLTPAEQSVFQNAKGTGQVHPTSGETKSCRFADQCTRRDCYNSHPSGQLCPSFPERCTNFSSCGSRHPATPPAGEKAALPTCGKGDKCKKPDCRFSHPGGNLCRFNEKCKSLSGGAPCTFRHISSPPGASEDGLPLIPMKTSPTKPPRDKGDAKRAPKSTASPDSSPGKKASKAKAAPTCHSAVNRALQLHDKIIAKEVEELAATSDAASQRAIGGVDGTDQMTRRALQAKLQELWDQRAVFIDITTRLKNSEPSSTPLSEPDRMRILKRELYRFQSRLPALAKRLDIENHLSSMRSRFTVIQGQTGSGKSTQIPQYAADLPCFAGKRIICSQPRKLAATSLAARVAYEYSGGSDWAKPGGDVGFRVGGHVKVSAKTRIEYVTEAVLLDMIARARRDSGENPFEDVGCVIVDEAHERSITCDLIMGSLKENHTKWRHVKVAITSATIDLDLFSGFFDNAPVVEIPGRMFPVDIEYVNSGAQEGGVVDAAKVATVVSQCAGIIQTTFPDPADGDILCFLPGQEDVLRAKDMFEAMIARQLKTASREDRAFLQRVQAHALFGKQDPDEQAQVFKKQTDRKVIFATDVAETSVTIDGVVFVVDSGLRKAMAYDPVRNMSSLKVHTVSRSSALQRCGRAGRTRPGRCFRLYSKEDFEEMEIGNTAEIFQQPLTLALLTLYSVGIRPREFHWIEPPNADAVARAEAELLYLGAVDERGNVTQLGRLVAEVQVDPKHVRLIDRAAQMGCVHAGVDLVAVLSVSNIVYQRGNKNDKASKLEAEKKRDQMMIPEQGDLVSMFRTYRAYKMALEGPSSEADEAPSPPKPTVEDIDDGEDDDDDSTSWLVNAVTKLKQAMAAVTESKRRVGVKERDFVDDDFEASRSDTSSVRGDDDDDDTMSVISVSSEISVAPPEAPTTSPKKPKRKNNEKKARNWCAKNGVNSKAMGIAYSTAKELLKTLSRAKSWTRGKVDDYTSATDSVSNDQLRRLITSGFFLNAAALKPTHSTRFRWDGPQYFALYSGVLGATKHGSAMALLEKNGSPVPSWVLFDSILRLNTTLLLVATPIEEAWVREESPAFYDVCMQRRAELPVNTLEFKNLSFAVLRNMFGKTYNQVNRWEVKLKCTLSIDRESGTLSVFCAPVHEAQIRATVDAQIASQRTRLEREASEEVYMGSTRAIVSNGFRVQQLLFDRDFVTIAVRNLPDQSDRELEQRFVSWARAAGFGANVIRAVDVQRNNGGSNTSASATISFTSKEAASRVFELVRGEASGGAAGESLTVTAIRKHGDKTTDSAASTAEFAGRIKLTWADGAPTGDAKVFFLTPHDANTFVRTARTIFQSTTMKTVAAGEMAAETSAGQNAGNLPTIGRATMRSPPKNKSQNGQPGAGQPAPLAPTRKEPTGGADGFFVVFDTDAIGAMSLEQQSRLRFGVNIKGGLPASMDECELTDTIRRTIPGVGYAKVTRKPVAANVAVTEMELVVRHQRMLPLLTCLDATSVYTDFVDQATRRAGVVVFCRDLPQLTETYQLARESPLWDGLEKPHGQPIRMELEHSYTTALHAEVFRCFREQIASVLTYARAKGVNYQEEQPTSIAASSAASKNMVTLKFLGEMRVLQRVKAKLDECLQSEKFESPEIHWLFGTVARHKLAAITDKHHAEVNARLRYFIRWIVKKNEYWVYGDAPSRARAVALLNRLIAELRSLEVVDRSIRIFNKKDVKPDATKGAAAKTPNIRQWLAAAPTARALYSYHVMTNRLIFVAGSESQVAALTQALQKDGLAFQPPKKGGKKYIDGGSQSKPDCGVCYMPADEPNIVLPICNHTYDVECIQNMIQPATCTFPLVCPAPGCGQSLRVDDASKILNDSDKFSSLVETAVLDYVRHHQNEALLCPKPGCNQVLSTATITGTPTAIGGRSIYCEQCQKSYCLDCSEGAPRPVARHAKLTCEQYRARQLSPQIAQHLRTIQEQILNVACPHCRSVFLDFSGCTSVQCGNATCGHYFCANCLVYSSTSSSETHHHVARCPNNPNPASSSGVKGYFTTDEQLAATHRALRTQKLTAYFRDRLTSDPMRCAVYLKLQRDLQDLGVELPKELQADHARRDASYMYGDATDDDDEVETPQDAAVRRHVKHVREQLLNLKCPKCNVVFVDFDFESCAALTCANPSCAGGICAYCLAQCGTDAHAHVSKCAKNPNRPYYYTTEAQFLAVHKERREGLVATYLAQKVLPKEGTDMVQRVKVALTDDFRSIGLDIGAI